MKIPIKEVIDSGAWYHCNKSDDEEVNFRARFRSFEKVNLNEVDNPHLVDTDIFRGILYLMELDIVNLYKKSVNSSTMGHNIVLVDQDDFEFNIFSDSHLCLFSEFARITLLSRFHGGNMIPKIMASGSFVYLVPDDDGAEYSISIEEGEIYEIQNGKPSSFERHAPQAQLVNRMKHIKAIEFAKYSDGNIELWSKIVVAKIHHSSFGLGKIVNVEDMKRKNRFCNFIYEK